ncbi:MAG: VOC family protein [Actinomycetota bacterium]
MTLRSVAYVILYVGELERSIAFYRDVIGLPYKFHESGYAEFATEGTKFALYERARLPGLIGREATQGGPAVEVAFLVERVDEEAARLRGAGVKILSGPVDRPWGQRTLHVLDPDGHVVEFAQEIPREQPRPETGDGEGVASP